jgi:hypothetical protein
VKRFSFLALTALLVVGMAACSDELITNTKIGDELNVERPDRILHPEGYPSMSIALKVPWRPQMPPKDKKDSNSVAWKKTKNCGQTCAVMIGAYFNHGVLDDWVITDENKYLTARFGDTRYTETPYGWYTGQNHATPMRELFWNYHRVHADHYHGNSAADVLWRLAQGHPVLVGVRTKMQVPPNGVSHWMLLVGWDGTYMRFNDPGRSQSKDGYFVRYTPQQFERSWADSDREYLVLYK